MWQTALGLVVIQLVVASGADAAQYVPGRYRADGLYVQPHFRADGDRVGSAEAWYDAMWRDQARLELEVGAAKLPPAAAGSSPGSPASQERRL
jgi:hypothetical protein